MLRIFGSHNSGFCLYSGESVWLNKKVKEINTFLDFMKIGLVVFFFSDNCCRKLSNSSIKVCSLSVEYRYGMIIHDSEEIVRLAKYYVVFDLKSYFRNMTDIETGRCKQSSLKSIYIYIRRIEFTYTKAIIHISITQIQIWNSSFFIVKTSNDQYSICVLQSNAKIWNTYYKKISILP